MTRLRCHQTPGPGAMSSNTSLRADRTPWHRRCPCSCEKQSWRLQPVNIWSFSVLVYENREHLRPKGARPVAVVGDHQCLGELMVLAGDTAARPPQLIVVAWSAA